MKKVHGYSNFNDFHFFFKKLMILDKNEDFSPFESYLRGHNGIKNIKTHQKLLLNERSFVFMLNRIIAIVNLAK